MRQAFKKKIFKLFSYRGWVGLVGSKGWPSKWLAVHSLGQIQPHQRNFNSNKKLYNIPKHTKAIVNRYK